MRIAILLLLAVISAPLGIAQTKDKDPCLKLLKKGYTQNFCDYDLKFSYKNIQFGSNIDDVSSNVNFVKTADNTEYDCRDVSITSWAGIHFDKCIFSFNSKKQFEGVQLVFNKDAHTTTDIKQTGKFVRDYLTTIFGKPEIFPKSLKPNMWDGNKVWILMVDSDEMCNVLIVARVGQVIDEL